MLHLRVTSGGDPRAALPLQLWFWGMGVGAGVLGTALPGQAEDMVQIP